MGDDLIADAGETDVARLALGTHRFLQGENIGSFAVDPSEDVIGVSPQ